tara:strand:+ start:43 stop:561 length:519 start_codon:yes stop_codon:yes gene_type:complete
MKIEIIDDFLSKYYQDFYLNLFSGTAQKDQFPFVFINNLNDESYKGNYYFCNVVLERSRNLKREIWFPFFDPLLARLKISWSDVHRLKVNLYPWTGRRTHHQTHKDYKSGDNLATCLYYVNDSNRDTIFDGKKKIRCKGNRAIIFDGSTPHHSTTPTDVNYGCSINIDYYMS